MEKVLDMCINVWLHYIHFYNSQIAYSGDVCFSFFGWLYEMAMQQELAEVTIKLPNDCTKCIECYREDLVFQGCPWVSEFSCILADLLIAFSFHIVK